MACIAGDYARSVRKDVDIAHLRRSKPGKRRKSATLPMAFPFFNKSLSTKQLAAASNKGYFILQKTVHMSDWSYAAPLYHGPLKASPADCRSWDLGTACMGETRNERPDVVPR